MSDETNLEDVFIGLLEQDAALAALGVHHHSDDTANTVTRLMVSAVKGEARYDGPGGHDYEVTIEYCNHAADAADVSNIATRIDAAIERDPDITGIDLSLWTFINIGNAIAGEREETDNARERVRIYPVIAVAYGIPEHALLDEDGTPILDEDGSFIIMA